MDRSARHLCNNVEGPSNTVENVLNLLPFLSELRFEEPLRRDFLYLESLHGLFSGSRAPSPGKALSGFPARSRISLNMSEPEDSRHRRPGLRPNAAISNLMRVPETFCPASLGGKEAPAGQHDGKEQKQRKERTAPASVFTAADAQYPEAAWLETEKDCIIFYSIDFMKFGRRLQGIEKLGLL